MPDLEQFELFRPRQIRKLERRIHFLTHQLWWWLAAGSAAVVLGVLALATLFWLQGGMLGLALQYWRESILPILLTAPVFGALLYQGFIRLRTRAAVEVMRLREEHARLVGEEKKERGIQTSLGRWEETWKEWKTEQRETAREETRRLRE